MAEHVTNLESDLTVIQIDYDPGATDPSRVFRSMAALIDAFHSVDRDLAHAISATIEPEVYLERVEAGSIRAVLRTVLKEIDDEALRNLDWKPLVGQYLVKGKHKILSWLEGRKKIESRLEIEQLQGQLAELAPHSVRGGLLPPGSVPVVRLLEDVKDIGEAAAGLLRSDSAEFISVVQTSRIETRFRLTSDEIEILLTQELDLVKRDVALLQTTAVDPNG